MTKIKDFIFLSDYLQLDNELSEAGVFDCIINKDSHFFINLLRLKDAKTPEFLSSYKKVNDFFDEIIILLDVAKTKNYDDKFFRSALDKFDFGEVNGINLGFSDSKSGTGFGKKLSFKVMSDAFDIVKTGSKQPEIFQLVGLFEENVAADRLSDMIATLILDDIIKYTLRINAELNITLENYPNLPFCNGMLINPDKGCEILYLPEEILHELPIARDWSDIDRVISQNRIIREEINDAVGKEWKKMVSSEKKEYIKNHIFMDTERCSRVIGGYKNCKIDEFTYTSDINYYINFIFKEIKKSNVLSFIGHSCDDVRDSKEVAYLVLGLFRDWVENKAGWKLIQEAPSSRREKTVQSLIQLSGLQICIDNDYDFTFEPNEGPGPVDIKVSRGAKDKTIIEVKLNSNLDYLHGYKEQIITYSKAENTHKCIYVYVKVEKHDKRDETIRRVSRIARDKDTNAPELFEINAKQRVSASRR